MQESKLPPGYVPLTHHTLSGYNSGNGESRNQRPRSSQNGSSEGNNRSRGSNNGQGRGGQRRRGSRPRPGGKPVSSPSSDE